MKKRLFVTMGLLLLLSMAGMAKSAQAQSQVNNATGCSPLDLIVLLDQSNSMTTTDPSDLRIDSVNNAINILYENAALRCPNTTHRVGVIGFGNSADVLVDFSAGAIRVDDAASNWESDRDRLESRIVAKQQGNTSLREALNDADQMFQTPPPEGDVRPRKRVVLIITDGAPCTESASQTTMSEIGGQQPCKNPDWLAHYLLGNNPVFSKYNGTSYADGYFDFPNGLESYLNTTKTLGGSTSINVLLFTTIAGEQFIPQQVNDAWNQVTQLHDGLYAPPAQIEGDLRKVTELLQTIISNRIGVVVDTIPLTSQNGECTGTFVLEPYSSSTTIIASTRPIGTGDKVERVQLFQPNGDPLPAQTTTVGGSSIRYNEGRTIQRYIITNPMPGTWTIKDPTNSCDVDATKETIPLNVQSVSPPDVVPVTTVPYYTSDSENYVTLLLSDSSKQPFNQYADYPLNVKARVTVNPAFSSSVVPQLPDITFSFTGNGEWRSDTPVPAPIQGQYHLEVSATVNSVIASSPPVPIFTAETAYKTVPPIPVSLQVVQPTDNSVIPLNLLQANQSIDAPFSVTVQFVDSTGNPQPRDSIFPGGATDLVRALLLSGDDATKAAKPRTITLSPSGTDQYSLVGTFQKPQGDNAADPPGHYMVGFSLESNALTTYNQENYALQQTAPQITFARRVLTGIRLVTLSPRPNQQMLLNQIVDTVPVENDIPLEVELQNQNGDVLNAQNVFSSDLGHIIHATLRDPNGTAIDTIFLTQESQTPSRFSGMFSRSSVTGDAVPREGAYTIEFTFGDSTVNPTFDTTNFAYLSPATQPVTFQRDRVRGVQPVLLSVAGQSPAAQDSPVNYELNSLNENGVPVPSAIEVNAALADLSNVPYTNDELSQFLSSDKAQVLQASIKGPEGSNIDEKVWLTRGADGRFTGELRGGQQSVDPGGVYVVSLEINPEVIGLPNPNAHFVVVRQKIELPSYLDRYVRRGVAVNPANVGGVVIASGSNGDLTLPLYGTPPDAFLNKISPIDFTLRIVDTNSQTPLSWEDIARKSQEGDAALQISDVVQVGVQQKNTGTITPVTNLREEMRDGNPVIVGTITNINDTDPYILYYGLKSNNLNNVSVVNFNDIETNRGSSSISRNIPNFLYDPLFWNIFKPVAGVILLLILFWLVLINFGPLSMRGEMVVTLEQPGQPDKRDVIPLGNFKLRPRARGRNTGVVVRRASAQAAKGLSSRRNSTAVSQKNKRAYEVKTAEGAPFIVPESGEGGFRGYRGKHQYRVVKTATPTPSVR